MAQKYYRALLSLLSVLMAHIIKWTDQAEKRSSSWVRTINSIREQIRRLRQKKASVNDDFIQGVWDAAFEDAKKQAHKEMGKKPETENLTWEQVFEENYKI